MGDDGPREPRSRIYDGAFYGWVLEPLLSSLHGYVTRHLPPGERVVDACCGTGGLSRRLAQAGRQVVGVDLSPAHVSYARRRARAAGIPEDRLRFELSDVTAHAPDDGPYDVAVIVLALHEMPTAARGPVLGHLLRVARRVAVLDFSTPMPWNVAGLRNRLAELGAGPEHFSAYRDFQRRGGLDPIFEEVLATPVSDHRTDAGALRFAVLPGAV